MASRYYLEVKNDSLCRIFEINWEKIKLQYGYIGSFEYHIRRWKEGFANDSFSTDNEAFLWGDIVSYWSEYE